MATITRAELRSLALQNPDRYLEVFGDEDPLGASPLLRRQIAEREAAKPQPSLVGEFGKGIASGYNNLQAAAYGAAAAGADALGFDEARNSLLEGYNEQTAEAQQYAPAVGSYKDVDSVRSGLLYAAAGLGQLVPFAAGSALTAGAGGAASLALRGGAAAVGRAAAERAALSRGAALTGQEAALAASQGVRAAALPGATAGLAAGSIGTETGLIYGDTVEKAGKFAPGAAIAGGALAGSLDVLPQLGLLKRAVGDVAKESLGKFLLKQTLGEASTEAAQTGVERAVPAIVGGTPYLTPELGEDVVNSAIIGGLGGAAGGGISRAIGGRQPGTGDELDNALERSFRARQDFANARGLPQLPPDPVAAPEDPAVAQQRADVEAAQAEFARRAQQADTRGLPAPGPIAAGFDNAGLPPGPYSNELRGNLLARARAEEEARRADAARRASGPGTTVTIDAAAGTTATRQNPNTPLDAESAVTRAGLDALPGAPRRAAIGNEPVNAEVVEPAAQGQLAGGRQQPAALPTPPRQFVAARDGRVAEGSSLPPTEKPAGPIEGRLDAPSITPQQRAEIGRQAGQPQFTPPAAEGFLPPGSAPVPRQPPRPGQTVTINTATGRTSSQTLIPPQPAGRARDVGPPRQASLDIELPPAPAKPARRVAPSSVDTAGLIPSRNPGRGPGAQRVREQLARRIGAANVVQLERAGFLSVEEAVPEGVPDDAEGFYDAAANEGRGSATLIGSNIEEGLELPTFVHELGGHGGFERLLKPERLQKLQTIFDRRLKAGDRIFVEAERRAQRAAGSNAEYGSERLAYLATEAAKAEQGKRGPAVVRVIREIAADIKAFIFEKTGIELGDFSDAEVFALADRMVRRTVKEAKGINKQADAGFRKFSPRSGSLGIPRSELPQIKAEHRGALVNFLSARDVSSNIETVDAETLKPSQAEFSPEKVQKAREFTGGDRSIIVSSDGYVVDGHHQWLAKREAGEPVKIIRLDAPFEEVLPVVKEFPSAETEGNNERQFQRRPGGSLVQRSAVEGRSAGGVRETDGAEVRPGNADAVGRDGDAGRDESPAWAEGLPAFGRKPLPGSVEVVGVHYSPEAGLKSLDGLRFGQNPYTSEVRRLGKARPQDSGTERARAYFYVSRDGAIPQPEQVVTGRNVYGTKLRNLYDWDADSEGIVEAAGSVTEAEQELIDRGYDGFYREGSSIGPVAVTLGAAKVPVGTVSGRKFSLRSKDFNSPEERRTISTARATAKSAGDESYTENRVVDSADIVGENQMTRIASALRRFDTLSGDGDYDKLSRELIDVVKENLLFLYDSVSPTIRARAKLWYDGANKIASQWASKYQIDDRQAAGVLAALSPQKDWFMNVSMAERVIVTMKQHSNESWSPAMTAWLKSWVKSAGTLEERTSRQKYADRLPSFEGRKLSDMSNKDAALFVRVFDETYNERNYRAVTPEGDFAHYMTRDLAETDETGASVDADSSGLAMMTWGSMSEVQKAVEIMRARPGTDLMRVIDQRLGDEHKVRNFYNNIIDPKSADDHVTIDTHAVGAGLLKVVSSATFEVQQNLGGASSNSATGASGLYPLFADAYREAAAERGVLAREMQSITWEAIRALFPAKRKKQLRGPVDAIIASVRAGEMSAAKARGEIAKLGGDVNAVTWDRALNPRSAAEGGTSYSTALDPDVGMRKAATKTPVTIRQKVRINLSAAQTVGEAIPGLRNLTRSAAKGDVAAARLLQDVAGYSVKAMLGGLNARVSIAPTSGLYGGVSEPSAALSVSFDVDQKADVIEALNRFARNFGQEQVHVRGGTKEKAGTKFDDGSYATPVYRWTLKETLSQENVQEIIDNSGLYGLTVGEDFLEAYYVGDTSNEADFNAFAEAAGRVDGLLGEAVEATEQSVARLWPYGNGEGAVGFPEYDGELPPAPFSPEVARRVAAYAAAEPGRRATTAAFDPITEPSPAYVEREQLRARIFSALPEDDSRKPIVRRAFNAVIAAVKKQFDAMPVRVEVWDGKGEPYASSKAMRDDVQKNNHLYVLSARDGNFGPDGAPIRPSKFLEESGRKDTNGRPLLNTEVLRLVHDYFAHNMSAAEFGPKGEDAAWKNHMAATPDPFARWALTSITKGQNAWQNFSPGAEKLAVKDRPFARQKMALMPIEQSLTGDAKIDAPILKLMKGMPENVRRGSLPKNWDGRYVPDPIEPRYKEQTNEPSAEGRKFSRREGAERAVAEARRLFTRADGGDAGSAPRPYARVRGGDGSGARLVGLKALVRARMVPDPKLVEALAKGGIVAETLFELTPSPAGAREFAAAITRSKQGNKFGASVYVYPEAEYQKMRLFVNAKGTAGLALKGDDIVSGFNTEGGGRVNAMMMAAIQEGGRRADAFDTVLPDLYAMNGMRPVARVAWNDEYAPDGWDKSLYSPFNNGEPDVVLFAYDPSFYPTPGAVKSAPLVDDYDKGAALQQKAITERKFSRRARQIETPEFNRWYRDGALNDENGEPIVFYRGAQGSPEELKGGKEGALGGGIYLTQDPAFASQYATNDWLGNAREGGAVSAYYVRMEKPLFIDGDGDPLTKGFVLLGMSEEKASAKAEKLYDVKGGATTELRAAAQKQGYDGIVQRRNGIMQEVVAFSPFQIKSAIGNSGAFSIGDSRVQFSRRAPVSPSKEQAFKKAGLGAEVDTRTLQARVAQAAKAQRAKLNSDLRDRVVEGVFDKFLPLKLAEERARAAGRTIAPEQSAYLAARLSTGSASTVNASLVYGAPQYRNGIVQKKPGSKSLLQVLEPVKDALPSFTAWMVGKRAEALAAQGRENNLSPTDIAELLSEAGTRGAEFERVAADLREFNTSILELARDTGLLSDRQVREYSADRYYLPFYRVQDGDDVVAAYSKKGLAGQTSGVKQLKGGTSELNDPVENLLMNTARLVDAAMKNDAMRRAVANFPTEFTPSPAGAVKDGIVSLSVGGRKQSYKVSDPNLLRAVTNIALEPIAGLDVFRAFKRLLTRTVTSLPTFLANNFVRDVLQTQIINRDGYTPADALKGGREVFRALADADKASPEIQTMAFAGASFLNGQVYGGSAEDAANGLRSALRQRGFSASKFGTLVDTPAKLWSLYQALSGASENANRAATYRLARAAGKSEAQAVLESRDVMDFSLQGNYTFIRVLGDMLPFFNARLQGLYKLGREGFENAAGVAAKGLALALASAALALGNDDDDRYLALPEWEKDTFWHLFNGDDHYRIPKPFELGLIFGTLPERMARGVLGDEQTTADEKQALARALWGTLGLNPVPQAVLPVAEAAFNYDTFRQAPIDSRSDEGKLPEARYNESTSRIMREVGEAFGISPKRLQHVFEGYLGGVGAMLLTTGDVVIRRARGEISPAWEAQDVPVLGSFFRTGEPRSTRYAEDLYEMAGRADEVYKTIRAYRTEGRTEDADELATENRGLLNARMGLGSARRQLSRLRQQQAEILRDQKMDADTKLARLEQLRARINQLSKTGVDTARTRGANL